MIVIITGANGFIGCHMTYFLVAQGVDVYCMVRKTSDLSLLKKLHPGLQGIKFEYADVTDYVSLRTALAGKDIVLHLAGSVKAFDQAGFDKINYYGTRNVLRACVEVNPNVKRIVIASSQAAAGPSTPSHPVTEDMPARPLLQDLYGISKYKAEWIARRYMSRLPIAIVRPCSVFGPGDSVSFDLFKLVKTGLKLTPTGPKMPYSIVDVDDLCAGIWACATNPKAIGETFFFSCDKDLPYEDLHEVVQAKVFGKRYGSLFPLKLPRPIMRLAGRLMELVGKIQGEVPFLNQTKIAEVLMPAQTVSNTKAKRVLGWKPAQTVPSTMEKAGRWYKEEGWF